MEAFRISVKFFAEPTTIADEAFVPVFHRWIQGKMVSDHLLVDVADYSHVHHGPGIALVSLEANFYADRHEGRLGLTYQRKQPAQGDFPQRLAQATRAALEACQRLEEDFELEGKLKFRADEAQIRIHDRLLAPNNPETFSLVRPQVEALFNRLYPGATLSLEPSGNAEGLFEVRVKASQAPSIASLLKRI